MTTPAQFRQAQSLCSKQKYSQAKNLYSSIYWQDRVYKPKEWQGRCCQQIEPLVHGSLRSPTTLLPFAPSWESVEPN